MKKRCIAVLLVLAVYWGAGADAHAAAPVFPDITDADTAENVAVLQMLGVIDGDGGLFKPGAALTRAAFCKMAVIIMGRADEEPLYRNRTIFPDVRSTHWARGYIGLAVTGENKIISGFTDGTFRPDDFITYAQAATLLMRVLGYTDADAGMLWPSGYMDIAGRAGLTDGISIEPGAAILRAQAAKLFFNMLSADKKDGEPFLSTFGTAVENVVIMALAASSADKRPGGIKTSAGVFYTRDGDLPELFLGKRGTLITDANGRVVTFLPTDGQSVSVSVETAGATWVKDSAGRRYDIPADTPVYTSGDTAAFSEIFVDIAPGAVMTIFYSPDGAADAVYMNSEPADEALIVTAANVSGRLFAPLTGGGQYRIYRDGVEADIGDIAKYDVATYDEISRVLRVSSFRITGYYENAWPNTDSPARVTVMGREFDVLPSAAETLSGFKLGQVMTLLFTSDLKVAGAVSRIEADGTAIGIVGDDAVGDSATVTLLDGMTIEGNPGLNDYSASQLRGELVSVTSSGVGKITLVRITARQGLSGALDISARTLGKLELAKAARIFERVGKGPVARISLDDIAGVSGIIPASKVVYASADSLGRVDTVVLDDVTGDRYIYGFLYEQNVPAPSLGDDVELYNRYVYAVNFEVETTPALAAGVEVRYGQLGGLVLSGDGERAVAVMPVSEYRNVRRSDFSASDGVMTVKLGGVRAPVPDNVQCYNASTRTWFKSLADARAFSDALTVYCDRTPETGGKARIVIVNG
jgi:hypothetical protein